MDYQQPDKRKKKDKAREKHERFGSFSAKHVRLAEALAEKRAPVAPPKDGKGKTKGKFLSAGGGADQGKKLMATVATK
jgi:hypothetical protein